MVAKHPSVSARELGKGRVLSRIAGRFVIVVTCLLLAACNDEVYRNLNARDANEMVAVLRRHDIAASRESDGTNFKVSVPQGQLGKAVDVLTRSGLPREQYRSIGEIFPGDGLIVSPFEQRARLIFAVSQELTKTIKSIAGITSARVHVVMPETESRAAGPGRSSASVVVMHRPRVDTSELSTKIRLIVANAVPELAERDVSVAFFQADAEFEDMGASASSVQASANNNSPLTWMLWLAAMAVLLYGVFTLFFRRKPA